MKRIKIAASILCLSLMTSVLSPRVRADDRNKETVVTFSEREVGSPEAIRSWFYPGMNYGQQFVYGKKRAVALAQVTQQSIPAMPDQLEAVVAKLATSVNDEPVIALKEAPLTAVKPTGEEVDIAQAIELPPTNARPEASVQAMPAPKASVMPQQQKVRADDGSRPNRLPQTASSVPLIGLLGILALSVGLALSVLPKQGE